MLNVYFGDMSDSIYNTNVYFNNTYKDKWITTPLAREIIKAVDKSEVIDERTIISPVFGNMNPKKLSGGVKTLLLIAYDHSKVFNGKYPAQTGEIEGLEMKVVFHYISEHAEWRTG